MAQNKQQTKDARALLPGHQSLIPYKGKFGEFCIT